MMDQERWRQIDTVLQAALERPPAERTRFLDETCSGDESLRQEIEFLLSGETALSMMDAPAFEVAAGLLSTHIPELETGQLIGHYRILSFMGAGGMGEVYLAEDPNLDRRVAIKVLPSGYTPDGKQLYRFQQEARAASALNHPNIITIYEIGQFNGQHFIVSEFIEGETLRQYLSHERIPVSRILDISIQVASALAVAHEAGIIHRDIKPENIMLRSDGYVKVLDFGLAKSIEQQEHGENTRAVEGPVTTPGLLMGTVKYMSPEQARGLNVDSRSDVFSLAVVIYEMVAGRTPFEGETNSDLIAALLKDEPPPLQYYSPDVPTEFQRITAKALRKDKQERYETPRSMLIDLQRLKQELELDSRHLRQQNRTGIAAATTASGAQPAVQTLGNLTAPTGNIGTIPTLLASKHTTSQVKRGKTKAAAISLALLIIVAGIIYAVGWRNSNSRAPFQEMSIRKIIGTENSRLGAISPDGKYLAHVVDVRGQSGLWIRELSTDSDTEIIPPAEGVFIGLTFSLDGDYVYYVRGEDEDSGMLYRAVATGGEPQTVMSGLSSAVTFSPDGQEFAFIRHSGEATAIILANLDGSGENQLALRKLPEFFNPIAPAWSPDGKVIACPAGRTGKDGYDSVVEAQVESGLVNTISRGELENIEQVAWLSDGTGLIVIAAERGRAGRLQIWHLSYPSGAQRRITNDLNGYSRLSLSADSKMLVSSRIEMRTSIWNVPNGDASLAEQITDERNTVLREVCLLPDGRIVAPSNTSGTREIWVMNPDGTDLKRLTFDGLPKFWPTVSADGRYIVFSALDNDDSYHIWRMEIDGSNPKQLTSGIAENFPSCSPNGWVIYASGTGDGLTLWKVPVEGGEPIQLVEKPSRFAKVSPDGKLIACQWKDGLTSQWRVAVLPFEGGAPTKTFDIPSGINMRWSPDSRALRYIVTRNGVSNIWSQPIDGSPPTRVTNFNSLTMYGFDWSANGLICSRGFTTRDLVSITSSD